MFFYYYLYSCSLLQNTKPNNKDYFFSKDALAQSTEFILFKNQIINFYFFIIILFLYLTHRTYGLALFFILTNIKFYFILIFIVFILSFIFSRFFIFKLFKIYLNINKNINYLKGVKFFNVSTSDQTVKIKNFISKKFYWAGCFSFQKNKNTKKIIWP